MVRISVIIPVYNASAYLEKCIKSLLAQTETQCEFIFVNDGSTDDSALILENFAALDDRIEIISQENKGVSAARNKGIHVAKGQYIGFVDADDHVKPDMFETLYNVAVKTHAAVVISNFIIQNKDGLAYIAPLFPTNIVFGQSYIQDTIFPYMISNDWLNSVANKLYDLNLIKSNKIAFPEGTQLGEDGIFNLHAFSKANAVVFSDYAGYFYREVDGSATRNLVDKDYFQSALSVFSYDYLAISPFNVPPENIDRLKSKRLIENVISYASIYVRPNKALSLLKRYRYISKMIGHPIVQHVVKSNWQSISNGANRFRKFILYCIRHRIMPMLWVLLAYSYYRNKK